MGRLPIALKEKALSLRSQGYSIKEIAEYLHIGKSTSSLWVRGVILNKQAKNRLDNRRLEGYYKNSLTWEKKRIKSEKQREVIASDIVKQISKDNNHLKIYCALLYWCEGGKTDRYGVRFINSDPALIKTFLNLFRKSFRVDERKFRVLLHLHDYHDGEKQKNFWTSVTNIPKKQFLKIFWKPHTSKRIRDNYQGCASIYYYDADIARRLCSLSKMFSHKL